MTFAMFASTWMTRQVVSYEKETIYRRILKTRCFPVIGEMEVASIQDADIDRIFQRESLFNLSTKEIQQTYLLLEKIFQDLLTREEIEQAPLESYAKATWARSEYR